MEEVEVNMITKKIVISERTRVMCFFLLTTLVLFVVGGLLKEDVVLWYDSGYYYSLSNSFFVEGEFNLLNFTDTFRGCSFPLILAAVKLIANVCEVSELESIALMNSMMFAGIMVVLMPGIFGMKKEKHKIIMSLAIQMCLIMLFWLDYIQYPLSDLPSLFLMMVSVYFAIISLGTISNKRISPILYMFASGFCSYVAYNIRTIYLYCGVILFVILTYKIYISKKHKAHSLKKTIMLIIFFILGWLIASIPQCIINHQYNGEYSPFVVTEKLTEGEASLNELQLLWGLDIVRYETYVGEASEYPYPSVYFNDSVGTSIIQEENITADNIRYSTILRLFKKYPLEMVTIYTKHIISGITPLYSEVYIHNIYEQKALRILINIFVWLISFGAIVLTWKENKYFFYKNISMLFVLSVPCILISAGAIEVRFYMFLHLFVYYYFASVINFKMLYHKIKENAMPVCLCGIIIMLMWLTIISDILAANALDVMLF